MKFHLESKSATIGFFILAVVATLGALSFRVTQVADLFHPGLWAEDGVVFLNEANELGIRSVVTPYAGYMHLFPRLAAYVSSFAPISFAPLLFHLAWLLAFIAFVYIVYSRIVASGVRPAFAAWALVLFALLPQAGEVFFTLTNVQWFSGLSLIVYLIFPFRHRVRLWHIALICAAGLTGPFSILALPVLAVRALFFRDFNANRPAYLAVIICAVIQAGFIFTAPKVLGAQASALDVRVWLSATAKFLSFGGEYPIATIFAFVFWASMPWQRMFRAVVDRFKSGGVDEHAGPAICASILVATAFGMIFIGFLRDDPGTMSPVILSNGAAGGSRYYLIPYSLLLAAAVVASARDYSRLLVALFAFSMICIGNLVTPERADFQWDAYSKLARVVPDVTIPIAPRIEAYPGWSVNAGSQYRSLGTGAGRETVVPLESVSVEGGNIIRSDGSTVLRSSSDNFLITFPIADHCGNDETIGLEVEAVRSFDGWMHVLWAKADSFNDKDSVLRFRPAGLVKENFAFKRRADQDMVRIRPGFVAGDVEVRSIRMFCLM